jgi:hypothetical protein
MGAKSHPGGKGEHSVQQDQAVDRLAERALSRWAGALPETTALPPNERAA